MKTSISNAQPNYFTLIRVVCIFTGFLGIIGSAILLWKAAMLQMSPMYEIKGGGIAVSDVIWLIQSLALIGAGIWIFRLKEIGRISILICSLYSLAITIYYYLQVSASISFLSVFSLLVFSPCFVNVLTFLYFLRSDVKAYLLAKG
jgi:hypothetical protein